MVFFKEKSLLFYVSKPPFLMAVNNLFSNSKSTFPFNRRVYGRSVVSVFFIQIKTPPERPTLRIVLDEHNFVQGIMVKK